MFRSIVSFIFICFVFSLCDIQGGAQQQPTLQDRLVAQLGSSEEEQRMDALVRLGALFTFAPGAIDDSTISALSNSMRGDSSPVVRAMAARAMELGGDARAVTYLIAALGQERQVAVRKAMIYALARYPSSEVTASLISLLKDGKHEIRAAATYALAESADPLPAAALIEVLRKRRKDEDAFARSQAARGLGRIAGRETVEALLKALTHDRSDDVRRESARALGKTATRQDTKVIEALRDASLSIDPYLSIAADEALASINSREE